MVDPVTVPFSLPALVRPSELIIVGTVVRNLPAVVANPAHPVSIDRQNRCDDF